MSFSESVRSVFFILLDPHVRLQAVLSPARQRKSRNTPKENYDFDTNGLENQFERQDPRNRWQGLIPC
jgi:hypothetical protein